MNRLFLGALLAVALGCGCSGEDTGIAPGSAGGACLPDGTCDEGLVCVFEVCLESSPCAEGELRACSCQDGGAGVETCWAADLWGPCVCLPGCGDGACDAGEHPENCPEDCALNSCGNGVIAEACDGSDLAGQTCVALGFTAGQLACQSSCQFDTAACTTCGDGVVEPGEACDDGDTIDDLTCSADCQSYCGDGVVNGVVGEECDTPDMAGVSCLTLGFSSGSLMCDQSCAFDTSNCGLDCTDGDNDGYGIGSDCLGLDCNDSDPSCWTLGDPCCPVGTGLVGDPCADVSQCTGITDGTAECLTTIGGFVNFPGGYCTGSTCTPGNSCDNATGVCVDLMGFVQYCLKQCTAPSECRLAEGYDCTQAPGGQPTDPMYCMPPSGTP